MNQSPLRATLQNYAAEYERIRVLGSTVTNLFLNTHELEKQLANKECYLQGTENSLFILIPRHDSFYELLFLSHNPATLSEDLRSLRLTTSLSLPFRASIIDREDKAERLARYFYEADFGLVKKLYRTTLKSPPDSIYAAMRVFAEELTPYLGFAKAGDEKEIYDILAESFDPIGDNLPELEEISDCIARREIAVLRKENQILSLIYYTIKSGILHSYYDVTRREHRGGNGYFMALSLFVKDQLQKSGREVKRALGWREPAKKKLIKHAEKSNQMPDGLVIYNLRQDGIEK